jgi:heme exporter protein C
MDLCHHLEKLKAQRYLFGLLVAGVTVWSFLVPDAAMFQHPEFARIFFWHIPCPINQQIFMLVGAYFALAFFFTPQSDLRKRMLCDSRAEAALDLSMIYAVLTIVSGMIFSQVEWGIYWDWDPRQYSYLIVVLIMGAYFAVRAAFPDPERRASHSSAYVLTATLPVFFLVFVFPYLPGIENNSLHPSGTIFGGGLKGDYLYVFLTVLTLVTWISVWLYRMRVRANFLEFELANGQLEIHRSLAAPATVVRPVSVSDENGKQTESPRKADQGVSGRE